MTNLFLSLPLIILSIAFFVTCAANSPKLPIECVGEYLDIGNEYACYKYNAEPKIYVDAARLCMAQGGLMAHITPGSAQLPKFKETFAKVAPNIADKLVWSSFGDDTSCMDMNNPDLALIDCVKEPQAPHTFFCEFDKADNVCGVGWKHRRSYCFKYIQASDPNGDGFTFDEARAKCQEEKADLASIYNKEDNIVLSSLIHEGSSVIKEPHRLGAWIGLKLTRKDGKVTGGYWSDGKNDKEDANKFIEHRPNGYPWFVAPENEGTMGDENCVEMFSGYSNSTNLGRWNDIACMQKIQGALCKKTTNLAQPKDD
jgi:hypothetical protein